jgi:alpha-mannosidase
VTAQRLVSTGTINRVIDVKENEVVLAPFNKSAEISSKVNKLFLIPNAHIDLAWLWPEREGELEVVNTYQSAVNLMQRHNDLTFISSSVAHLMYIEKNEPQLYENVRQLVAEGRWELVGGMIVEPDANIPSGESVIRQLLYGKNWVKRRFFNGLKDNKGQLIRDNKTKQVVYDENSPIEITSGYNPDAFGHQNIVHILAKAGITNYTFLRPSPHESHLEEDIFIWEGPDNSKILAGRFPFEYGAPGTNIKPHIERCYKVIDKNLKLGMCAVGVGNHGGYMTENNLQEIKEIQRDNNPIYSTLNEFYSNLHNQLIKGDIDIPVWPKDLQKHAAGCYSTLSKVKKLNRDFENVLLMSEKFDLMASIIRKRQSSTQDIKKASNPGLINQFHDILAGTCIKSVYTETAFPNYERSIRELKDIIDASLNSLSSKIGVEGEAGIKPIFIFNPHTWEVTQNVEVELAGLNCPDENCYILIDSQGNYIPYQIITSEGLSNNKARITFSVKVPSLGWTTYKLVIRETKKVSKLIKPMIISENNESIEVENTKLIFSIKKNTGGIQISDKSLSYQNKSEKDKLIESYSIFEGDYAAVPVIFEDQGDTWGHHITKWQNAIARFIPQSVKIIEQGAIKTVIRAIYKYQNSEIRQDFIINNSDELVRVKTHIDLKEKRKMYKLIFRTHLDHVKAVIETPYGHKSNEANGEETSMLSWIDLSGEFPETQTNYGLSILNNGKSSHHIDVDSQKFGRGKEIGLTLGRTAIYAHHTPRQPEDGKEYDYIEIGEPSDFEYVLYPHKGTWQDANLVKYAEELNQPIQIIADAYTFGLLNLNNNAQKNIRILPQEYSLLKSESEEDHFKVTVVKQTEDENSDDIIIRGYETKGFRGDVKINIPFINKTIDFTCKKNEIITLRIPRDQNLDFRKTSILEI